jgi:hypothetical protein
MVLTGFLQLGEELSTGHLDRFIEWNLPLFDHLVVYADAPRDGSLERIRPHADLIISSPFKAFRSEIFNR